MAISSQPSAISKSGLRTERGRMKVEDGGLKIKDRWQAERKAPSLWNLDFCSSRPASCSNF